MNLKKIIINTIGYSKALKIKQWIKPYQLSEIIIDISASCNAECPFCPRIYMPEERSKGFITIELFEKILLDAKQNNILKLRLYSTAEPTMHPKFDQLIDIAKEYGFEISVSTNASLLHKHIDSMMKVDYLQYSIEGWDKESYEKYRFPLKFDKIYSNIKQFYEYTVQQKKGPKISTNLLITKKTNIQQYMQIWGDFIGDVNIHFMYEPVKYEDGKFIAKSLDTESEFFHLTKQKKDFFCAYPFSILTVAFDGEIALCCDDFAAELNLGNLQQTDIYRVYNSAQLESIRNQFYTQKLDICKECSRFSQPTQEDVELIQAQIKSLNDTQKNKIVFNY